MTTISPIRYEVEIQEPLSTPVPMPPSMLSSDALVIWMLRIAMKAPIIAANTEIQTVTLARSALAWAAARGAEAGPERVRVDMASPLRRVGYSGFGGRVRRRVRARLRCDGRDHGHAGAEIDRRAAVERDLDGDALHHLGEIAGRVVGRQQREFLAAGRRETVDMAVDQLARKHVDGDVDLLAFAHVRELGFLEIRHHIGARRGHQRHQLRAGLHELAGAERAVADHAVD